MVRSHLEESRDDVINGPHMVPEKSGHEIEAKKIMEIDSVNTTAWCKSVSG